MPQREYLMVTGSLGASEAAADDAAGCDSAAALLGCSDSAAFFPERAAKLSTINMMATNNDSGFKFFNFDSPT